MKTPSHDAGKQLRSFEFYPLEDRILLHGDAVVDVDASAIDAAEIDLSNIELALYDLQALPDGQLIDNSADATSTPTASTASPTNDSDTSGTGNVAPNESNDGSNDLMIDGAFDGTGASSTQSATPTAPIDLIFVDSRASDADSEIAKLTADTSHQWLIVRLDANQDGFQQISDSLAQYHDLSSIHLIGDAEAGTYQLGNQSLDLTSLNAYSGQIATWAIHSTVMPRSFCIGSIRSLMLTLMS